MTSRSCLFRYMKQDLSEKRWVFLVSAVLQFCVILLSFLFVIQVTGIPNQEMEKMDMEKTLTYGRMASRLLSYFTSDVVWLGGILAFALAIATAFFGFRHLFFVKMQDTMASLPVSRITQFMVNYFNGLLTFMIPCFLVFLICTPIGAGTLLRWKKEVPLQEWALYESNGYAEYFAVGKLLGTIFLAFISIQLIYLLVYHLTLLAMGLCGNYLNAIVLTLCLGSLPGLLLLQQVYFGKTYLETYYVTNSVREGILSLAPLFLPILFAEAGKKVWVYLWSFLFSLLLLGLAVAAHSKRKNELAGHGMEKGWLRRVIQMLSAFVMGGFGFAVMNVILTFSTGNVQTHNIWNYLGIVLASGFCYGVLNVIFDMDPHSLLRGKRYLLISMVAVVVCEGIYTRDLLHFDSYLPEEEEILSMAIWDMEIANGYRYHDRADENEGFMKMNLTDSHAIYSYLERMVQHQTEGSGDFGYEEVVRVTLKNGKSYYRRYISVDEDRDVKEPLFISPEYIENVFILNPEQVEKNVNYIYLMQDASEIWKQLQRPKVNVSLLGKELTLAYNRDMREHPGELWNPKRTSLCSILMEGNNLREAHCGYSVDEPIRIEIKEGMVYCVEVLEKWGMLSELTRLPEAEEIDRIVIEYSVYETKEKTFEDLTLMADGDFENEVSMGENREISSEWVYGVNTFYVTITNPQEIERIHEGFVYNNSVLLHGMSEEVNHYVTMYMGEKEYHLGIRDRSIPAQCIGELWKRIQEECFDSEEEK